MHQAILGVKIGLVSILPSAYTATFQTSTVYISSTLKTRKEATLHLSEKLNHLGESDPRKPLKHNRVKWQQGKLLVAMLGHYSDTYNV